jgi:hypothetical protein
MSLKFVKFLFSAILTSSLLKDIRGLFWVLHTVSRILLKFNMVDFHEKSLKISIFSHIDPY